MPRILGDTPFSQNYEVAKAGPLDARLWVSNYSDLTGSTVFGSTYAGMIVSVYGDSNTNNGVYYYNGSGQTNINNWIKLGLDKNVFTGGTVSGTTIFTNGLSGNTISGNTLISNTISGATYLGVNTLYTSNGSLIGDRIVNLSNNSLTFSGGNISFNNDSSVWYDNTNMVLNIGNSISQSAYNLEVNGNIRGNTGLYLGQLSAPTGLTATSGTSGSLSGGTYVYQIVAGDIQGEYTNPNSVSLIIPSGVTNGSVSLSWSNVIGAATYRVYRTINSGQTQYCNAGTVTNLTDVSLTGTSPNQLYSTGSATTFNASTNFSIINGLISSTNGITIYGSPTANTDIILTRLNTNNLANINSNSGNTLASGRLILKGLAWNGAEGTTPNVGFLQVSNVYNNGNPTIDKLSFYVGSASNTNNTNSTLNAVERFNIQSDGSINGLISNRFNLTQSLTGSGNVTLFSGSSIVIGNLTSFQNTFNIGDTLNVGQYGSFIITGITSNSQLEINEIFSGTTGSALINVILSAGTPNGVVGSSTENNYQSVFAPDFSGTFTADSGVYTVTASTGVSFSFTPNFTGTTGSYPIASSAYNVNNKPYYINGTTKFSVSANGNATLDGKLMITSGITGTSASVGSAKFTSGVVTLTNTCITSNSKVFLTVTGPSGNVGIPTRSGTTINSMQIVSLSAGTTSIQTGDNSIFDYWIIN